MTHRITKKEREVIDALANAWNLYLRLPDSRRRKSSAHDELHDFRFFVHSAQRIVLARPATRAINKEMYGSNGIQK